MSRGSLATYVGEGTHWEESAIAYVCKSILSAIAVIHSTNHIHRGRLSSSGSDCDDFSIVFMNHSFNTFIYLIFIHPSIHPSIHSFTH